MENAKGERRRGGLFLLLKFGSLLHHHLFAVDEVDALGELAEGADARQGFPVEGVNCGRGVGGSKDLVYARGRHLFVKLHGGLLALIGGESRCGGIILEGTVGVFYTDDFGIARGVDRGDPKDFAAYTVTCPKKSNTSRF